jgi:hypothetical protein
MLGNVFGPTAMRAKARPDKVYAMKPRGSHRRRGAQAAAAAIGALALTHSAWAAAPPPPAPSAAAVAAARAEVPQPLRIELPVDGAVVGNQVAVLFRTSADLARFTLDAKMPHVHLHVQMDDEVIAMPTFAELVQLGGNHYLYLFDLPASAGQHRLKVYWSDSQHETIAASVRGVTITVRPADDARPR